MATVVFADLVGSTSLFERLGDEAASRFVTQLMGTLGNLFKQHDGRVVKLLGDGLFVVFPHESAAVSACTQIQNYLLEERIQPGGTGAPVQMQMGIESGEIVEIDGDCFGDTVNSSARLADLAGASQILTTENVWKALAAEQRAALRSMGPIHLRGKAETSNVYRVEWLAGRDEDSTMAGRSMYAPKRRERLDLFYGEHTLSLESIDGRISIGRLATANICINDPRVSRLHATVEWRGGHFLLADASSFGTWVYLGNQMEAAVLRRTECYLIGEGEISLGCERTDENAPRISFAVRVGATS
jgi:class 3 adenylate cyclase